MARPGLMRHKKFARLARLIGNEVLARGHLELLWEVAYENGDDLVGDAGDLEHLAKWSGPAGALAAAMTEAGFVDQEGEQYRVHDLWDHAPDYVRRRRQRENERQEKGAALSRSAVSDRSVTGQSPPNAGQRPPNGRPRAPAPAPAPTQEAAAATRASARRDDTQLGSEAGATSAPPSAETPVSEPASPSPAPALVVVREPVVVPDRPVRPLVIRDETELDQDAAELRGRLEARIAPAKLPVAAIERTNAVRKELGALVARLGVDRCEALCWRLVERRKRQGLPPPAAMAFFVPMLAEEAEGGDPMPEEIPGVDVNQVLAARDAEVERRWAPLVARLTPAQRETYELEKKRLAAEILAQGLWTSEQNRMLEQTEGWLFEKWSRKAASGEA